MDDAPERSCAYWNVDATLISYRTAIIFIRGLSRVIDYDLVAGQSYLRMMYLPPVVDWS